MSADLITAVLLTLSYSDQFSFPLTNQEVLTRLISNRKITELSSLTNQQQLQKITTALLALIKRGIVSRQGQYYYLTGRDHLVESREQRQAWSIQKQADINQVVSLTSRIPWLVAVVVTGSVAVSNALLASDIDFLMVTKRRRLWLTRLLVLIITWWRGKQRTWNHPVDRSWCFNMWLDEDHLTLPLGKRSIYTAYEVCQAKWAWDKANFQSDFYHHNSWVKQWLPLFWQRQQAEASRRGAAVRSGGFAIRQLIDPLLNSLLDVLELAAYLFQHGYMYDHMSREWVGQGYAYFHPRDTGRIIDQKWQRSLLLAQTPVPERVLAVVDRARQLGQQIVLVTGVFDLFHIEHRRFLRKAKAIGDILVIGVESDRRVKKLKGVGRPIYPAPLRVRQLEQTGLAEVVFVLPEQFDDHADHLRLLQIIQPRFLAVSEHTPHLNGKRKLMRQIGGKVIVVHSQNPALSTTLLLKQQLSRPARQPATSL